MKTIDYSAPQKNLFIFALSFCLLAETVVSAQPAAPVQKVEDLWEIIELQLSHSSVDTSFQLISLLVRGNCGQDFDCLYENYTYIKNELESKFDLTTAIAISEAMVELAKTENRPDDEAHAHVELQRFHDALGNKQLAAIHIDKAEQIFESTNNQKALIRLKLNKLEESLKHRELEEVLPQMEALLGKAVEIGDTVNEHRLHIRLILHTLTSGDIEGTRRHIRALEQIPISDPIKKEEYKYLIFASFGRAEVAKKQGFWQDAIDQYLVCLQWCEDEPSRWMEIRILHNLGEAEMELGNLEAAGEYLNRAETKSTELDLDDHLAYTYELMTRLAEAEERYEDALKFSKKQQFHAAQFKSRSAGFDLQKHELAKEKERMTAEAKKKEAELRRKDVLIKILALVGVLMTVATGLILFQRKKKKKTVAKGGTMEVSTLVREKANNGAPIKSEDDNDKPGPTLPEPDRLWLNKFDEYLRAKLSDERLTVPMVATDFAMSESSLLRQLKRLTGMSPSKYIQEIRLEKGKELLEKKEFDSVAQVASMVGYGDTRSFSRSFKKRFGKLPSEYIDS